MTDFMLDSDKCFTWKSYLLLTTAHEIDTVTVSVRKVFR